MAHLRLALIGVPIVVVQNEIICAPTRSTVGYVSPSTAVLQGNTVNNAVGMHAITVTDGEFFTTAPFIRCTDVAGATIVFKSY
jgi:hypothetical protein